jgi:hypothetical protein
MKQLLFLIVIPLIFQCGLAAQGLSFIEIAVRGRVGPLLSLLILRSGLKPATTQAGGPGAQFGFGARLE